MLFRMFSVAQFFECIIALLYQQVDLFICAYLFVICFYQSLFTASMASADRSHSPAVIVICQHRGLPFICSDA